MRYESAKTPRGNVGVSYENQALADAQAAAMDTAGCTDCTYCTDCTGVLKWAGHPAEKLIALNGLRWPVAVSKEQIQIGCQCHGIAEWANFSDSEIESMAGGALDFWIEHKAIILSLAKGAQS